MKIIIILFILILSSCSSNQNERKKNLNLSISRDMEREMMGESDFRRQALERYRQLRLDALEHPEKYRRYRRRVIKSKPTKVIKKIVPNYQSKKYQKRKTEREIEIMQNIDLFCIKKQGSGKFVDGDECKRHCLNVVTECEENIENAFYRSDRKLIYCVKNGLSQ